MTGWWKSMTLVLLVAVVILPSMGCKSKQTPAEERDQAFADLRADVTSVITDPGRRQEVLKIVDELHGAFNQVRKGRMDRAKEFRALNADYDTPRSAFTAHQDRVNRQLDANRNKIAEVHRRLIKATTPDEWKDLAGSRSDSLDAVLSMLRSS